MTKVSAGFDASTHGIGPVHEVWTPDFAQELQDAVDRIFLAAGDGLAGLKFSLTIADPCMEDCPLIGCSAGFTELCGYSMQDIVGRSCRFLVDPVPKEMVCANVRSIARDFIAAAREGREYELPSDLREDYMPPGVSPAGHGVFLMQVNAKRDGSLFRNMFYLRTLELDERPYIIGLQSEVLHWHPAAYREARAVLEKHMVQVERLLASRFWLQCGLRRQEVLDQASPQRLWTVEQGDELQDAVDKVFGLAGDDLRGLRFSLTLADPGLPQCPLIGCSTGFSTLCGYAMSDILGRNCRFLVDPVPKDMVSSQVRSVAHRFCDAVRNSMDFRMSDDDQEPWMPGARVSDDGVFCAQMNARKDGSLFENMFYMRRVELDEKPYIIGLQTGLPSGSLTNTGVVSSASWALQACAEACKILDSHMAEVERVLAGIFWLTAPMRRQDEPDLDDGFHQCCASQ